jgi:hypothetical protein
LNGRNESHRGNKKAINWLVVLFAAKGKKSF